MNLLTSISWKCETDMRTALCILGTCVFSSFVKRNLKTWLELSNDGIKSYFSTFSDCLQSSLVQSWPAIITITKMQLKAIHMDVSCDYVDSHTFNELSQCQSSLLREHCNKKYLLPLPHFLTLPLLFFNIFSRKSATSQWPSMKSIKMSLFLAAVTSNKEKRFEIIATIYCNRILIWKLVATITAAIGATFY